MLSRYRRSAPRGTASRQGLEEDVKTRLRVRASRHGRSMEAEARDILRDALRDDLGPASEGLGTRISRRFADIGLEPGEELKRPDWGEMKSPFEE